MLKLQGSYRHVCCRLMPGPHVCQLPLSPACYHLRLSTGQVRGLRRGIAIHHGGLPKTYRQVVEILFRAGHLRVSRSLSSAA